MVKRSISTAPMKNGKFQAFDDVLADGLAYEFRAGEPILITSVEDLTANDKGNKKTQFSGLVGADADGSLAVEGGTIEVVDGFVYFTPLGEWTGNQSYTFQYELQSGNKTTTATAGFNVISLDDTGGGGDGDGGGGEAGQPRPVIIDFNEVSKYTEFYDFDGYAQASRDAWRYSEDGYRVEGLDVAMSDDFWKGIEVSEANSTWFKNDWYINEEIEGTYDESLIDKVTGMVGSINDNRLVIARDDTQWFMDGDRVRGSLFTFGSMLIGFGPRADGSASLPLGYRENITTHEVIIKGWRDGEVVEQMSLTPSLISEVKTGWTTALDQLTIEGPNSGHDNSSMFFDDIGLTSL